MDLECSTQVQLTALCDDFLMRQNINFKFSFFLQHAREHVVYDMNEPFLMYGVLAAVQNCQVTREFEVFCLYNEHKRQKQCRLHGCVRWIS